MTDRDEAIRTVNNEDENKTSATLSESLDSCRAESDNSEKETKVVDIELPDISGLECSLADLTKRLCGGIQGDFYEDGSPLDDKHRPGQLRGLFAVREQLEKVLSKFKSIEAHMAQDRAKAEMGTPVCNKKMMEMVDALVQQRTASQFRDLNIRYERLEKELEAVKARNEKLEEKVKGRDGKENAKFKKHEDQIAVLSNAWKKVEPETMKEIPRFGERIKRLEQKMTASEDTFNANRELHEDFKAETIKSSGEVKENLQTLGARMSSLQNGLGALEAEHEEHGAQVVELSANLDSTSNDVMMLSGRVASLESSSGKHDKSIREIQYDLKDIDARQAFDKSRITRVEQKGRETERQLDRIEDNVENDRRARRRDTDDFNRRLRRVER